jgi:hypothetical protein
MTRFLEMSLPDLPVFSRFSDALLLVSENNQSREQFADGRDGFLSLSHL